MIINLPTFLMAFVTGLAGLLGAGVAVTALVLGLAPGHEEVPGELPVGWRRTADAALRVGARSGLVLAALAWPLLYVTLSSYVHRITGAMCIYGVTQRATTLVHLAEIAWPTSIFALGLYLVLARVDRDTQGQPNRHRNRWVLGLGGAALAITAVQTLRYLVADKGGDAVSCCTTVQDLALGPGFFQYLGFTLPTGQASLVPYLASSGAATVLLAAAGWGGHRLPARLLPAAGAVLGLAAFGCAALTLQALFGAIAPRLLGLPFHHCVYCLLKHFVDAPVFLGAAFGATIVALWATAVALLADAHAAATARTWTLKLWRVAALLQGCSLVMIGVHLLAARLR